MKAVLEAGLKLQETSSLCAACKRGVPAEIIERGGRIFLRKACPDHGPSDVLIASDAAWYRRVMERPAVLEPPAVVRKEIRCGCPFDCGACASHQQAVHLPVIPITSACNLDCPICYTINRNDGAYHVSLEEFARLLEVIRANDPEMKIINLTGGEPTLHPQFLEIIRMCSAAGIHRITISTHGLPFLRDEAMLRELAELRARIVLSFDSFDEEVNRRMVGARIGAAKMKILDRLEEHGIDTTLIPVVALGVNDGEVGRLVQLMLERECIRSLEIHTMTFTGQGGAGFEPGSRITTPDVLRLIEEGTAGEIRIDDFVPSPCAHPLCYQTCYLLRLGERDYLPFTRFMSPERVRELLTGSLYMEPGERLERALGEVINELWAMEIPSEDAARVLGTLKRLIQELFPPRPIEYSEQQAISERAAKTIYIHSHMDEESFDTDRIRQCCVGVPSPDGGNIPTCSYNVLYRGRDPRFSRAPQAPITLLPGGRFWP